jgi:3-methyl-2-oxobutanoate hydroxymethyltransferase
MYAADAVPALPPVTVPSLRVRKAEGPRLSMLTCYDASFARCLDAAGIDVVLVGDSLGMVVQGHRTTLSVSLEDMVYHTAAVARGLSRALLVADMPFGTTATPARALDAATRLVAEGGAAMVKLEGGGHVLDTIRYLVDREIPVCAHLGLTPQSVHRLGGFKVQGRDAAVADRLRADAHAVVAAGAELLVLECVPRTLAAEVTAAIPIPTIGIGAGVDCDGQVLVLHDMLGVTAGRRPRFVHDFLADGGSVGGAVQAYVAAVREGRFPAREHGFD